MFDSKFTGKFKISPSQYRRVFFHLCKEAKKISLMDSTMIPMRIKELETKKNTLPSFEWIKDKLEDIGNSNVLKSKKNIPKLKKQKEVQNLKKEIATAKKYFESLKKKKGVDKRSIKTLGNKIKNLEEKIMKH